MKTLIKLFLVLNLLAALGGCAVHRGKADLKLSIGGTSTGNIAHIRFDVAEDGALVESFGFDPAHVFQYGAATVRGWINAVKTP